jgi:hypothetical protein
LIKKIEVGDILLIKEGRGLGRKSNPCGEVRVKVTEIKNSDKGLFTAICLDAEPQTTFIYYINEVIGKGKELEKERVTFT